MRKYMPYLIIITFLVITIIILLIPSRIKDDKLLYLKKNYNLSSNINKNDYLNIEILINNNKSYFIDKNQIIHSYLTDDEITSIVDLEIVDVINNDYNIVYENEKYYSYTLIFKVLFKTSTFLEWYIDDVKLMLGYNGNKNYEIEIGNFSFIKLEDSNNIITISNVSSLLSNIGNNKYLTALVLGIRSTKDEELLLEKIKIMNEDIIIGNNISKIDNLPDSNNFKEVLGYEYINQLSGDGIVNYEINNEIKYFIIPLYYEELMIVNSFPIEFTINKDDEIIKYYYNGMKYYDIIEEVVKKENIFVYDIL